MGEITYCKYCSKVARWMFHREMNILTTDSDDIMYEETGDPVCDDCKKILEEINQD